MTRTHQSATALTSSPLRFAHRFAIDQALVPYGTEGLFRETWQIKVVRKAFSLMSRLTPSLAARLACRALATPPRAPEREWQKALRLRAMSSEIEFGSGHLAIYEWGEGPVVLMVHGWTSRATHMGKLIAPLVDAGYRVVAFDGPAHGASSGSHTEPIEFAAAVHAVVQYTGHVHVAITHSFGGAAALLAQRDWGDVADHFVLISPFESCMWFTEMFRLYAGVSAEVMSRARQIVVDRYAGRFTWERMSVVELLRSARRPALLIHDEDDAEIPFAHSTALLAAGPQVQRFATKKLGHHRLLGDATVIERVVRFVKDRPHRYIA